jgi:ankyrin repeat protein
MNQTNEKTMLNPYQSPDFSSLHTVNFGVMTASQLADLFQQLRQQRDDVLSVAFHVAMAITQQLPDQDAQRKACLDTLYSLVLPNITARERNTLDRITQRETSSNSAPVSEASEPKELEPPLHAAARLGDLCRLQQLLTGGAAINEPFGPQKLTALMIAAGMGHADVVKFLLHTGASDSLQSEDGRCALDWSFAPQSQPKTTALLYAALQQRLNAEEWVACLEEKLCWAAKAGDISATQWLLQQGAGRGKYKPLEQAIAGRHPEVVQLLLNNGADVHGGLQTESLPLPVATRHFAPVSIFEMLVLAGADAHTQIQIDWNHLSTIASSLPGTLRFNASEGLNYLMHVCEVLKLKIQVDTLVHCKPELLAQRLFNTTEPNFMVLLKTLLSTMARICDIELTHKRSILISSEFKEVLTAISQCLDSEKMCVLFQGRKIRAAILQTKYTEDNALNQQFRIILIKLILLLEFKCMREGFVRRPFFEAPVSEPDGAPIRLEKDDLKLIATWERALSDPQITKDAVLNLLQETYSSKRIQSHLNLENTMSLLRSTRPGWSCQHIVDEQLHHEESKNPRVQYLAILKILFFNRAAHLAERSVLCQLPLDVLVIIFNFVNREASTQVIWNCYLGDSSEPPASIYKLRSDITREIGTQAPADIAKLLSWMDTHTIHPYTLLTAPLSCHDGSRYQQLIQMALHGTASEKTRLAREVLFLLSKGLEKAVLPKQRQSEQAPQPLLPPGSEQVQQSSAAVAAPAPPIIDTPAVADEVAVIRNMLAVLAPKESNTNALDLVVYLCSMMRNTTSEKLKCCISQEFKKTPIELLAFLDRLSTDLSEPLLTVDIKQIQLRRP